MLYLLVSGTVALVFGLLLFFVPSICKIICCFFDRMLFLLDEVLNPYRVAVGVFLLLVGLWILYLSLIFPKFPGHDAVWVILLTFSLLFLFFPNWLRRVSQFADRIVLRTDELVQGLCRVVALLLLISAVYIYYSAYLISQAR